MKGLTWPAGIAVAAPPHSLGYVYERVNAARTAADYDPIMIDVLIVGLLLAFLTGRALRGGR